MNENKKEEMQQLEIIFKKFLDNCNLRGVKDLGSGGFGLVKEVKYKEKEKEKEKEFAAKLIKRENNLEFQESDLIKEFRGPNIVKVTKIYNQKHNNEEYNIILMEKSQLKDLKTMTDQLLKHNLLKFIFHPFEIMGDNFIRYFIKQLVEGLKLFNIGSFCHFDIKPPNILIFTNLVLKFSDFGLLRNPKEIEDEFENVKIPGGTHGYLPPDYYYKKGNVSYKESIKYDFFALGATIFYIKFGKNMLNFIKFNDGLITGDYLIKLIEKAMDEVKSEKLADKDFIDFLCSLIQFKADDRPNFEEIYRNKWLNKNWKNILEIYEINNLDEQKLIIELNKSDFLFDKKEYINKTRNSNINGNKNNNDNKINDNNNIINENNNNNINENNNINDNINQNISLNKKNNKITRNEIRKHKFILKL